MGHIYSTVITLYYVRLFAYILESMYVCLLVDMHGVCMCAFVCACMYRHTYAGMQAYIYVDMHEY